MANFQEFRKTVLEYIDKIQNSNDISIKEKLCENLNIYLIKMRN